MDDIIRLSIASTFHRVVCGNRIHRKNYDFDFPTFTIGRVHNEEDDVILIY